MSEHDVVYYDGMWQGEPAYFNRTFRGHFFTVEECRALMKGEPVQVHGIQGRGVTYAVEGRLSSSGIRLEGKLMLQFHGEKVVPNNPDYEFGRATGIYDLLEPEQHAFEQSIAEDASIPDVVLDNSDLVGISFETEPDRTSWSKEDIQLPFMKQVSNMLDAELAQFRNGSFGRSIGTVGMDKHAVVKDFEALHKSVESVVAEDVAAHNEIEKSEVADVPVVELAPDFLDEFILDDLQDDIQSGFEDEMREEWNNPFVTEDDVSDTNLFVSVDDEDPFAGLSEEEIAIAEGKDPIAVEEPLPVAVNVSDSLSEHIMEEPVVEQRQAVIRSDYPDFFHDDEYDDDVADDVAEYIAHSLDDED